MDYTSSRNHSSERACWRLARKDKANINDGATALHVASEGQVEVGRLLLEAGSDKAKACIMGYNIYIYIERERQRERKR